MRREGHRVHGLHSLEVKNTDKRIAHGLRGKRFGRRTASNDVIGMGVQVDNLRRMGYPTVDNVEVNGVQDIDSAVLSSSEDMSTSFHERIVILGSHLWMKYQQRNEIRLSDVGRLTFLIISPLLTSITYMVSWQPATRISDVPLDVKLMQRRSAMVSSLLSHSVSTPEHQARAGIAMSSRL